MKCLYCLQDIPGTSHYGLHPACFTGWFNTSSLLEFKDLTRKSASSDFIKHADSKSGSFFHGKFKKYSAKLDGESYIFKMSEPEAPELPMVEYLSNQIATVFSIPVAKFYIIHFQDELVFVTKNFIEPTVPMDLRHIYHYVNHEYSCEELLAIIKKNTNRPYYTEILLRTILFDALIGNHDRHGRNLALIVTSNNTSLSPIYDNVSYLGLESGKMLHADFNPVGKIETTSSKDPGMRDYVYELRRLGYETIVEDFYHSAKQGMDKIGLIIDMSFCSPLMQEAIKKLVWKRFKELENELKE